MHALHINHVCKDYNQVEILKDINISIEAGEFLILVGPSGCGKSTLLSMIAGLDSVKSGSIHIGDKDVTALSPKDRDIAMVFQSYALYPNMTVRKNISFGLEIQKKSKSEINSTITRVAKLLQMENLLDRKPAQLSGGQRQRVAMGRALARDPKLFLFDEPLSNLDAKLRVEMRSEIKKLHKAMKPTIVYVTHDQIEAMTLGDKIAVMKEGIIQQFGTPDDVYTHPVNMFVASFMGSPAMNFIPVTLSQDGKSFICKTALEQKTFPVLNPDIDISDYKGKEVILGLRPEHFHNRRDRDKYYLSFDIHLEEFTGADIVTYSDINGANIVCRRNPKEDVFVEGGIALGIKIDKVCFFDKDTEERIG
jgi:multiple sugar transport system ATP-binding protein